MVRIRMSAVPTVDADYARCESRAPIEIYVPSDSIGHGVRGEAAYVIETLPSTKEPPIIPIG